MNTIFADERRASWEARDGAAILATIFVTRIQKNARFWTLSRLGIRSYRIDMPEQTSKRRSTILPLSNAALAGQLVWAECRYCPGRRHYDPADLQRLLGDVDVHVLARRMRCERCGRSDGMTADVILPVAAERERITVRRLVGVRVRREPVWAET